MSVTEASLIRDGRKAYGCINTMWHSVQPVLWRLVFKPMNACVQRMNIQSKQSPCVGACWLVSVCDSQQGGYCPGSGVHRGGVIEIKHNVSLCPTAHLDLLVLRDLALWNATVALFSSLPVECARAEQSEGEQSELAQFSFEEGRSFEMDYLMAIRPLHSSPLKGK